MANKRWAEFPNKGAPAGTSGPRKDSVSPEKTRKWAGVPGGKQPKDRSHGFRRVKPGPASEGI
jgi:hypothetical protein